MVNATLEAPVASNRRISSRHVSQSAADNSADNSTDSDDGDRNAFWNNPGNAAARQRCKAARKAKAAAMKAAKIEAMILEWLELKETAQRLFGEAGTIEDAVMDALRVRGEKSCRLPSGKVVVVLDEYFDPTGMTSISCDHIQVLPAGVIPE